jgi:hypothetical protein
VSCRKNTLFSIPYQFYIKPVLYIPVQIECYMANGGFMRKDNIKKVNLVRKNDPELKNGFEWAIKLGFHRK